MKKILAVLMAALMLFSIVPFAASAAVDNDDLIIQSLLNDDDYYHLAYVKEKNYFDTELKAYTALSLYDGAWDNLLTGSVDVNNAKVILLGLIERFEAEYQDEVVDGLIEVLEYAKKAGDVVNTVNKYTGLFDFAESSDWSTALTVVSKAAEVLQYADKIYEDYAEGIAIILSCKAASMYYGEILDYLAANCANSAVKTAAAELKENIDKSLEEATEELVASLADAAGKDVASLGIELALDAYSVTAAINAVYNGIGSVANTVFNTKDKYTYMSSLAIISAIEDVTPAYVEAKLAGDDAVAKDFAVGSLLTIRETGETMLLNLGKVTEDSIAAKLFKGYNTGALKKRAGIQVAKLGVISDVIKAEGNFETTQIITAYGPASLYFYAGEDIAQAIKDGEEFTEINAKGAFASVYSSVLGSYIKVAILFGGNYPVTFEASKKGNLDVSLSKVENGKYATYYFINKYFGGARTIDIVETAAAGVPAYKIIDTKYGTFDCVMVDDYARAAAETAYTTAPEGEGIVPGDGSGSSGSGNKKSFSDIIRELFQNIFSAFKNLFKIFG